jgi:enoyl-CoA hydratase/carnithine racemase
MVAVSRAVGRKRAMEMLLTGTPIDARTAADWGLVNRVVPAGELDATVDELAAQVAASSSYTVAVGKRAFWEQIDRTEPGAYDHTREVMAANAAAAAAQEGIGAFLDKRQPVWPE